MNNTDYGYNIPRKIAARQSCYSVSQKSSPLKLFVIFSLVVNLCNWKLSWLLLPKHVHTFTPILVHLSECLNTARANMHITQGIQYYLTVDTVICHLHVPLTTIFVYVLEWSRRTVLLYYYFLPLSVMIPRVKTKLKVKRKAEVVLLVARKLLWSMMELKRCTVIDMRWKRKPGSRLSPEIDAILRPSSKKKAIDDSIIQRAKCLCCDRLEQATCLYQRVVFGCLPTRRLFSCCTTWASRHAHIVR